MKYDFKIHQGADKAFSLIVKDQGGAVDLAGYVAAMQIRQKAFSATAIDTLTTENGRLELFPAEGRIRVVFPNEITQSYPPSVFVYDLEIKSAGGQVTRILEGKVSVSPEVTRDELTE